MVSPLPVALSVAGKLLGIFLRGKAGASLEVTNKAGFNPAELALSLGNQSLSRYLDMYRTVPRRARDVPLQRVSCLLVACTTGSVLLVGGGGG